MSTKVIVNITLLSLAYVQIKAFESKDTVQLVTRGKNFKGNFTYTIHEFLDLPYAVNGDHFRSAAFSTKTNSDLQWRFVIRREPSFNIKLSFSVPSKIAKISGLCECGLIDVGGMKRRHYKKRQSVESNNPIDSAFGSFSLNVEELRNRSNALLPDGRLTIYCEVDAVLVYNLNAAFGVLPTEVIVSRVPKELKPEECRKELASDTWNLIKLFDDEMAELKSTGNETVKCPFNLLYARMPRFKSVLKNNSTIYDLSDEMNPEELEELLLFIYMGTLTNSIKNCPVLFKVGFKYGFECLWKTCQDVMLGRLKTFSSAL